jgi:hypothetical protein
MSEPIIVKEGSTVKFPLNKNKSLLASFTEYCQAHPEERFWQALRNWSGYNFIYASNRSEPKPDGLIDTFYKED